MPFGVDDRVGDYRIEDALGATRTGALFHARHLVLPRRVVIKVASGPTGGGIAVQLLREACILEAIQHPGVPQLYESSLCPAIDRRPWFACERIDGTTFADLLAQGPLPHVEVAAFLRDATAVLAHAHRRGVIHCGLRPDRIVRTPDRRFPVCVVDWSEARLHDAIPATAPALDGCYSAPELAYGDNPDDRVDVFSLGAIAYVALTGRRPFGAGMLVPSIPDNLGCPKELARMVSQMLSPDRFDRPSAADLHHELVDLVTDVSEVIDLASAAVRVRKPRWTPPLPFPPMSPVTTPESVVDLTSELEDD